MATIDRTKVKADVRFLMGGVDEATVSDALLTQILEDCITTYGDDDTFECEITYCTLMNTLKYLIRQSWLNDGSDSLGSVKRKKEKEGNVTYEDEYYTSESGSGGGSGWEKMYQYFLKNPAEVCPSLEIERSGAFGLVSIGGTQQDKYVETENNCNNRNFWGSTGVGSKFTSKREVRRRNTNYRSKYLYR